MEIDGTTKLNRPETSKDKKGFIEGLLRTVQKAN